MYTFLHSFTHLLKILLFTLYSRLSTVLGTDRVSDMGPVSGAFTLDKEI